MDLKKGIEDLLKNKTFKYIISAILTIGNFLNGSQVRIKVHSLFNTPHFNMILDIQDHVMAPKKFCHGILQGNYRSFSSSFVKLSIYNTVRSLFLYIA